MPHCARRSSPTKDATDLTDEHQTSSRFVLIFGMLFAFQPNSEGMQPAPCFHDHIPKFGTTKTDDAMSNPIPLDIADNMFIDHSSYPSCRTGCPPLAECRPKFISVTAWRVRFRECSTSSTRFNLCENCYISGLLRCRIAAMPR